MSQRLLVSALVALAAATAAAAQESPAAESKRGAYVVKYAAAKELAGMLAKHFKGAAEIQAGPEGTSNCLLINAPPAAFDEVLKTLDQLDRRPRSVTVEVLIIELPADKEKRPDAKELSGTIDDVATRLAAMLKKGQVAGYKVVELLALEGQPGMLSMGENKPFEMGPGLVSYRNVGTQIKVTPQIMVDQSVTLDLKVEHGRGRPSTTVTGKTEFLSGSFTGKVSVASGKAALVKDIKVNSKEGEGETLIVVSARVGEPGAAGK